MAGLIGLTADDIVLQDALQAPKWAYEGEWVPHPVVRLTTTLPVAVPPQGDDKERTIVRARWGIQVGKRPVGNARDDKLRDSPLWSKMLAASPCLVATTGVYEMVKHGKERTSYWFRRVDGEPIVMPGLARWKETQGEDRVSVAIVTTEPSPFFKQFHDRQVCALGRNEADVWMTSDDVDELMGLLRPAPNEAWEAVPVHDRIFAKGRREMEDLVEVADPLRWGDEAPSVKDHETPSLDRWS